MDAIKTPKWIYTTIAILIIIILSGLLGGNYYYKEYKEEIKNAQKKNDSLRLESVRREDSLISIAETLTNYSDNLRLENNKLHNRNNNLYYEIKKIRKQIFVIDTSFMVNAKRISESSNRFYIENDSIR